MKNWFGKEYKWIATVIIVIFCCTACGRENVWQKMVESGAGIEYLYDSQNNAVQIYKIWDAPQKWLNDSTDENIKMAKEDVETPQTDEENKEDEWDVDFEIVREGYIYHEQQNEIDIYYPQLSGFNDAAKEDRINALIEEDVKKIIGEKNKEGDDTLYCISLDYKIEFLNESIISILYKGKRGYIMQGRARMPAKVITITIDIEEEKIIALKDVVIDFGGLSDMLLADEFEHITMWEGTTDGYEVSWLFSIYGDADVLEENLGEKYYKWYTDGENFIIIIEDVLAAYNEYSISTEEVKHILDSEFLKKLE